MSQIRESEVLAVDVDALQEPNTHHGGAVVRELMVRNAQSEPALSASSELPTNIRQRQHVPASGRGSPQAIRTGKDES